MKDCIIHNTVNREYFIILDNLACAKIYICNINDNAVQGRLSDNAKNYCTKYFRYNIFQIYGIIDLAERMQLRFMV